MCVWRMNVCVVSELKCLGSPVLLVMDGMVFEREGQCNGLNAWYGVNAWIPPCGTIVV
jgi:hypothetical protein